MADLGRFAIMGINREYNSSQPYCSEGVELLRYSGVGSLRMLKINCFKTLTPKFPLPLGEGNWEFIQLGVSVCANDF
jgi:hypothetical protein